MTDVVLGIDLSLRGLGLCSVPADWDLDVRRVRAITLEYPLRKDATTRQQVERLRALSFDVRTYAIRVGATHAFMESYAFNMATMAHSIGEIGGVTRLELSRECGLDVQFANMSTARKLAYGRMPPRGLTPTARKAWLLEPLRVLGLVLEDHNQGDGFVVANHGLHQLGAPCVSNLIGPVPVTKRKRARKEAA